MALRLGLYQTVLDNTPKSFTKRQSMIKVVAKIKRNVLSDYDSKRHLEELLYNSKYSVFYKEIIKEVVSYHPNTILNWLNANTRYLKDDYFLGLYLSLINELGLDTTDIVSRLPNLENIAHDNFIDKICLISNIKGVSQPDKLYYLNHILFNYGLENLKIHDESLGFRVNNILCDTNARECISQSYSAKVTILVTAYNAASTLKGCVTSLLSQSWSNIEIIIINDASTDSTLEIAKQIKEFDERVKIVDLPKNVGTFAAKTIGAKYATGDFLTCQDSDDWAHPRKIELQVLPLIKDEELIASTSYWLRIDILGNYHIRQYYPFFRQNPASPMFRLAKVNKETGLWHLSRTGADSEFFERLKLVYGKENIIVIKKPLTLASHRKDSLMTSTEFGAYNKKALLKRLDYWEAWRKWHIDCLHKRYSLTMLTINEQLLAPINIFGELPKDLIVDKNDCLISLTDHTYIR